MKKLIKFPVSFHFALWYVYGLIKVVVTEESYTSRAGAIDEDKIPAYGKHDESCHFSKKRIKRGLYQSKVIILINADINGASNIKRKVYECIPRRKNLESGTVDVSVLFTK